MIDLAWRLLSRVRVSESYPGVPLATPCWEWCGAKSCGYGQMYSPQQGRRLIGTHRASYELFVGVIPAGLHLDHLCRNRTCCNPDHLEPVTHAENLRRGWFPRGPESHTGGRTRCPKGHPYDSENTYRTPQGWRKCRTCAQLWHKEHPR